MAVNLIRPQRMWADRLMNGKDLTQANAFVHEYPRQHGGPLRMYDSLGLLIETYREYVLDQYKTVGPDLAGQWVAPAEEESRFIRGLLLPGNPLPYFSSLPDSIAKWAMLSNDPYIVVASAATLLNDINVFRSRSDRLPFRVPRQLTITIRRLTDTYSFSKDEVAHLILNGQVR